MKVARFVMSGAEAIAATTHNVDDGISFMSEMREALKIHPRTRAFIVGGDEEVARFDAMMQLRLKKTIDADPLIQARVAEICDSLWKAMDMDAGMLPHEKEE